MVLKTRVWYSRKMPQHTLFTPAARANAHSTAQALFNAGNKNSIVCINQTPAQAGAFLRNVDVIFTDADGTLLEEGYTFVKNEYVDRITTLHHQRIRTIILTGKSFEEAKAIIEQSKQPFEVTIMCEKGAYSVEVGVDGKVQKKYLLSSDKTEQQVKTIRAKFEDFYPTLIEKYKDAHGTPRVGFGWSGSDKHTSVISIDIFNGLPPANYLQLIGKERDAIKLQDKALLAKVQSDVEKFFTQQALGARVVHLGNGNTEFAPNAIEKDNAIEQSDYFKRANGVLCLGDSFNDLAMFKLTQKYKKASAGLVVYREPSIELAGEVDFVTTGMANIWPLLQLVGNKTH